MRGIRHVTSFPGLPRLLSTASDLKTEAAIESLGRSGNEANVAGHSDSSGELLFS